MFTPNAYVRAINGIQTRGFRSEGRVRHPEETFEILSRSTHAQQLSVGSTDKADSWQEVQSKE
jgi:hypothetical protein